MKVKPMLHCHLLMTGVFPAMAESAPRLPGLRALLTRSGQRQTADAGAASWLCRSFGVERQRDWPVAPFAALGDALAPGSDYWLRADPVHLHLMRDSLVLTDGRSSELTLQQSLSLVDALNRHFVGDGLHFYAPVAERWYVRLAEVPALNTQPIDAVIGQDIHRYLPQGEDAMKWHGWLNEVQMLLHDHPVNVALEHSGRLPVNSLWPWGGGVLPRPAPSPYAEVWSDDALVRGLAGAGGEQAKTAPGSADAWLEQAAVDGAHLIVPHELKNGLEALQQMEQRWFMPLLHLLKRGAVASIHVHLAGPDRVESFSTGRGDLWKVWRRPRPLEHYLHG
jgi:hypothetical protein